MVRQSSLVQGLDERHAEVDGVDRGIDSEDGQHCDSVKKVCDW